MKLVEIDQVYTEYAKDIAALLRESGFDARYDDLPRVELTGHPIAAMTTPIYVPQEQAQDARRVLAAYYAEARAGMHERISKLPPWWHGLRKLIKPALLAIVPGVVFAIVLQEAAVFFAGWFISFPMIVLMANRMRDDETK
ncbi:MAG: hypothetical protein AAGB26_00460 [Planctomycetota bacterium]